MQSEPLISNKTDVKTLFTDTFPVILRVAHAGQGIREKQHTTDSRPANKLSFCILKRYILIIWLSELLS